MQVHLSGSSPALTYAPCKGCDPTTGWQAGQYFSGKDANGTDSGFTTSAVATNVTVSVYGTGLTFEVSFAAPAGAAGPGAGAGTSSGAEGWTTTMLVNGTTPPASATVGPTNVKGLDLGLHEFQLTLTRTDEGASNTTWARVDGVLGAMGTMVADTSRNTTIDDTEWQNGTVSLSPGWNMVDPGQQNFANETLVASEQESLSRDFNNSISWTTDSGASTAIQFSGSAVWVFGITGGDAGMFDVRIDNVTRGTFDASGGPRAYDQVLFQTAGLEDGPHTLELVNQWGQLAFDRLVASSGLVPAVNATLLNPPPSTKTKANPATKGADEALASATASAGATASADKAVNGQKGMSKGSIAGAVIGSILGVLLLALGAFLLWRRCKRDKRHHASMLHGMDEYRKPWYKRMLSRDKGWAFANLDENHTPNMTQLPPRREHTKRDYHNSSSSFGSTADHLADLPPAHTRRSFLPTLPLSATNFLSRARRDKDVPPVPEYARGNEISRVASSSPDPMTAALGGHQSPLSALALNRSFSGAPGDRRHAPPAITLTKSNNDATAVDRFDHERQREREHGRHMNNEKVRHGTTNSGSHYQFVRDSQPLSPQEAAHRKNARTSDAPSISSSVREWYDWFGLSTYGPPKAAGAASKARRNSAGGSNEDAGSMENIGIAIGSPTERDSYPLPHLGLQANHGLVSNMPGAEPERSPRRRFFGSEKDKHESVSSNWRYM